MKLTLNVSLAGKTAVITGAGGVICGCMAKVLAEAGANVAVLDINETAAKKVAEEITAAGGTALAVGCDVLSAESLKEAHELVARTYGPCRILVNGAGGNNPRATTAGEFFDSSQLGPEKTFFDIDKDTYHPFCSTICPAACVGTDPEPLVSIIFRLKSVLYIIFFLICPVSYNIFQKINASFFILRMKKIRP